MFTDKFKEQLTTAQLSQRSKQALHLYIIIDSAQDPQLLDALKRVVPQTHSQCLLAEAQHLASLAKVAPHLATLPAFNDDSNLWKSLFSKAVEKPTRLTLLASALDFASLHAHLASFTEIILPDGDELFLAFWDPAILATLVGQKDDETLHITGPVFTPHQRTQFLKGIDAWWYWDRSGEAHQIQDAEPDMMQEALSLPLKLTQAQDALLIESSIPDQFLCHISQNKPNLLVGLTASQQYARIKQHLQEARGWGLHTMQDILDYIYAGLIYGEQMQKNLDIRLLLYGVKRKEMSLKKALAQFPNLERVVNERKNESIASAINE